MSKEIEALEKFKTLNNAAKKLNHLSREIHDAGHREWAKEIQEFLDAEIEFSVLYIASIMERGTK